ncbi:hypothetical protein [Ectothiorhodosinus mongolicus]|uniref:hypothetical protein n=1 Tax=Ectothiorhodosinus mongolicus TaxID=233100 RepID=UPI003B82FA3A
MWAIVNDVRGAVDSWGFKQYVLGVQFYRFIRENFASYIEAGDDSIRYAELPDNVITPHIKDDAIKTKDSFIYPSRLFAKVALPSWPRLKARSSLANGPRASSKSSP